MAASFTNTGTDLNKEFFGEYGGKESFQNENLNNSGIEFPKPKNSDASSLFDQVLNKVQEKNKSN